MFDIKGNEKEKVSVHKLSDIATKKDRDHNRYTISNVYNDLCESD